FSYPFDLAADSTGYVYVADRNNDRVLKFTSDGDIVSQWDFCLPGAAQPGIPERKYLLPECRRICGF
ncbi:MAG: hypothetical protein V2I97_05055, partial [Desulfococcaceae bacterium]|nr:hypothetical protein [Desulfococcaceae bacterium]